MLRNHHAGIVQELRSASTLVVPPNLIVPCTGAGGSGITTPEAIHGLRSASTLGVVPSFLLTCTGAGGSGAATPEAVQGAAAGGQGHSSTVEAADQRPSECRVPHSPRQAVLSCTLVLLQ